MAKKTTATNTPAAKAAVRKAAAQKVTVAKTAAAPGTARKAAAKKAAAKKAPARPAKAAAATARPAKAAAAKASKAATAAPSGIGQRRAAAKDEGRAAYRQRRSEIMLAAAELFKKEGFRGTSIGRIAESLGMDRATLYYYVGSKEELFEDVVSTAVRANVLIAEGIRDGAGTAPEKLRALITSLMNSYAENYPFLYVFIQENLSHVARTRTAWSQEMRRLNKSYEDVVVEIIQSGLDAGTIRPIGEAWVMAYGVIGMVAWTNRWFNPERSSVDAATIGAAYAELLLGGMGEPAAPVNGRSSGAAASARKPARLPGRR